MESSAIKLASCLFPGFIDVSDVVALSILDIYLHSRKSAGLVQGVHKVELELENEVKEPVIPHLNEHRLLDDVHQALDELLVLVVKVLGKPDCDLVVAKIEAHIL